MDISEIKKNIIIDSEIRYFDYTASGLGYSGIEDEILRVLKTYANTHSEAGMSVKITTKYYENARKKLKDLLGVDENYYLLPAGFGASEAIKKFQEIMGIYIPPMSAKILKIDKNSLPNLPLVIISPYEHHSNEISFRQGLCEVVRVPLDRDGGIDFGEFDRILKANRHRKIIGSFSVASNVTGIISDYKKIYFMIKAYGGILALDGSSFVPHGNLASGYYDALFISPHKLLGGVGACGILVIRKELLSLDEPTFAGGGNIAYASRSSARFVVNKELLEQAGTPPITGLIRAYLAFKLRNDIGLDEIKRREDELSKYFISKISKIEEVRIYGNLKLDRVPTFSFNVDKFNPYDFVEILSEKYGVQARAGCSCAGPYGHDLLGLIDDEKLSQKPGWVRISLHYTQDKDDIDYLISAIKSLIKKRDKIRFSNGKYQC